MVRSLVPHDSQAFMPEWSGHYALAPFGGVSQHTPPPAMKMEADSPTLGI